MPPLPVISGQKCIKTLEKIGYRVVRQKGSHVRLNAETKNPITIPLHKELDRGTLRSILRTAELDIDAFLLLLD